MPGIERVGDTTTLAEAAIPLLGATWDRPVDVAANIVTLPGQAVLSFLLALAAGAALGRRGRYDAAAAWPAAIALGTAIEVVCKQAIARPALFRHAGHVAGFDSSWPSGHTLRILLVAAALAAAWPAARAALALWAAASLVLVEVSGMHTPSDIAGGILLAALLAVGAAEIERSGLLRGRALGRGALRARAAARRPG